MLFSWDHAKREINLRKHDVRFEIALVFDDPLHITRQDRIEGGELASTALQAALRVSQPTVSRLLTDLGDQVARIGRARATR